jgi:Zn-dependent peptidase ImmA (M78 family)
MDEFTSKDIDERVEKIIREIGIKEPPLNLEDVLGFLDLHRGYYDLNNPNLIQEVTHRLKIGAFKIKDILGKIDLRGLWYPDEKKILIDENIPELKKRWVSSHEIGHRIVPWHKDFIFGDTAETLDPDYHEQLEAEANYAASSLLFLASRFTEEARDYNPNLKSVQKLSKIYGNTQTMTLRRFVQFSQNIPMVAVVSKPHWKGDHIFSSNDELCRYCTGQVIPDIFFREFS